MISQRIIKSFCVWPEESLISFCCKIEITDSHMPDLILTHHVN